MTGHIQLLSLRYKFYGYWRITAVLRRSGMVIMPSGFSGLCARTTSSPCAASLSPRPLRIAATAFSSCPICCVASSLRGWIRSGWLTSPTFACARPSPISLSFSTASRKVVGWALAPHLDASLAVEALDRALADRKPEPASLIHHSDRGVQCASTEYRQRLADHDIAVSMSRPGNPYDNAKAESFMKTLKAEEVDGRSFKDIEDARRSI